MATPCMVCIDKSSKHLHQLHFLSVFLHFTQQTPIGCHAEGESPLPLQPVPTCPMCCRDASQKFAPLLLPLAWQHSTFCTVNPLSKDIHKFTHKSLLSFKSNDVIHCAAKSSKRVNNCKLSDTGLHFIKVRIQCNYNNFCTEAALYKRQELSKDWKYKQYWVVWLVLS